MKRGRNQRRRQGPNINRALDSNGPDVRIRGTATQIHDKYQALARDANSSGDRIKAESYLQHAEHYFRLMKSLQPVTPPAQQQSQGAGDGDQPAVENDNGRNERSDERSNERQNNNRSNRSRRDNRPRHNRNESAPTEQSTPEQSVPVEADAAPVEAKDEARAQSEDSEKPAKRSRAPRATSKSEEVDGEEAPRKRKPRAKRTQKTEEASDEPVEASS